MIDYRKAREALAVLAPYFDGNGDLHDEGCSLIAGECACVEVARVNAAFADLRALADSSTPRPDQWPTVTAFAEVMREKLRANSHKRGWSSCRPSWLLKRLRGETTELARALALKKPDPRRVAREAADVANFAMMLADVAGDLAAQPAPSPEAPDEEDICACGHRRVEHDGKCQVRDAGEDRCYCCWFAPTPEAPRESVMKALLGARVLDFKAEPDITPPPSPSQPVERLRAMFGGETFDSSLLAASDPPGDVPSPSQPHPAMRERGTVAPSLATLTGAQPVLPSPSQPACGVRSVFVDRGLCARPAGHRGPHFHPLPPSSQPGPETVQPETCGVLDRTDGGFLVACDMTKGKCPNHRTGPEFMGQSGPEDPFAATFTREDIDNMARPYEPGPPLQPHLKQPGPETCGAVLREPLDGEVSVCGEPKGHRSHHIPGVFDPPSQPGPETCGAVLYEMPGGAGTVSCANPRPCIYDHQPSQPVSEDEGRGPCERCDADPSVQSGLCECREGASSGRLLRATPIHKPTKGSGGDKP